eukprot:Skav231475  [mRNA]  locus=scaffold1100:530653:539709:- [translate_table: standard]
MAQPGGGTIPLTEYRRDVPPGWGPGIADYPLRTYFDKLRLWYRVFEGADEVVGPLVAGRLVGRAQKLAVNLRLPRPHGGHDVGDEALIRLSVDEVRDPNDPNTIIQQAIPSGVQALCNALRDAFGQTDQDMVSRSLEQFFEFRRGKLSLQEYAVEWDLRYDEAKTRSNLHLNEVAKFYLFFKHSQLPAKFIEDIKLQIHGDLSRFTEARSLALRLSQRGQEDNSNVFYGDPSDNTNEENPDAQWDADWTDPSSWSYYENQSQDGWYDDYDQCYEWPEAVHEEYYEEYEDWPAEEDHGYGEPPEEEEEVAEGYYKGKGRNAMGLGCDICGSKWHASSSCPVNFPEKGKGKPFHGGHQGKGRGKSRPYSKGYGKKGKGKGRQPYSWRPGGKSYGKGRGKSFGKKGKYFTEQELNATYHVRPPLQTSDIKAYDSVMTSSSSTSALGSNTVYRSDHQTGDFLRSTRTTKPKEDSDDSGTGTAPGKVLSFAMFLKENKEHLIYHTVRGEKRRGLLIDPGAASGLIGSETLRDIMEFCVPTDKISEHVSWQQKTTSVAGISGASDETLGEVHLKLHTSNRNITYKGDVLGGAGSLCPALVGNPTLRQQQAAMFADWFPNGDGLLSIHREEFLDENKEPVLLRLLLTDSGHYLLPVDGKVSDRVTKDTKKKVSFITHQLVQKSLELWPQEEPQIKHCFQCFSGPAETDRSEVDETNMATSASEHGNQADSSLCVGGIGTCQTDRCYSMSLKHSVELPTCQSDHDVKCHGAHSLPPEELSPQSSMSDAQSRRLTQMIPRQRDNWTTDGHWLIREHRVPRRTMYTPQCAKDCPVPLDKILSVRRVEIHYLDDEHDDQHEDNWHNPVSAHRDLGRPWTGRTYFLLQDDMGCYWAQKRKLDEWFPKYTHDCFPFTDEKKLTELRREYRAMPEEFYTKSGRRVVTPDNVDQWLKELRRDGKPECHFMELYSGSGRLSLAMATAGLSVSCPIDLRYGWDMNNQDHQQKIWHIIEVLKPRVVFASPRCKFHSTASNTMSPEKKLAGRVEDEPGLNFTKKIFQHQAYAGRGYGAEQPWGSTRFKDSPLCSEELPGCRGKQRCDQCMLGAVDELQQPIQKATNILSNFKWKRTSKRCGGHRGKPHGQLQGKVAGINRTAMAAVYPRTMCHEMCKDVINYLNDSNQIKLAAWPRSLHHVWHSHLYKCEKCKLGRSAPPGVEHSLLPGECRHGRYPTADGKRPRKNPEVPQSDPIRDWKKAARLAPMEDVELTFPKSVPLGAEARVYWKSALFQVIQDALAIFSEAADIGKDYHHWLTDQTLLAILRERVEKLMYLKGVKICLRPQTRASPEPQLAIHSAPLRIEIHGTVKNWTMDEMQDMTTCSNRQIHEAIDAEAWQITLFGKELGDGGKRHDSVAKSAPRTPTVAAPSTPRPSTSAPARSSPSTPAVASEEQLRDQDAQASSSSRPEQPVDTHPREPVDHEEVRDEQPEVPEEEFKTRQMVSNRPIYDFKKVFQKLPQLAKDKPDMAARLLLGLHEKYWHAPPTDLKNLLAKAGMPVEVLNLVSDAVMKCSICRRYVRLPNRPQLKLNNAGTFNQCVQADLFELWDKWFLLLVDEATRYKVAVMTPSRESQELQQRLLEHWMRFFGPPGSLVMDQEASLMSHETAGEFERLSIERKPKGTTAGPAASQHTGTGLVERHVGLMKLTMLKLRAELDRQGIICEVNDIAMEAAMAHNSTLNYGGVTPAMAVFGVLPRGFYDDEASGIMASAGALQTDLTTFEKAVRIRQMSLAAVQQAIVEDRTARANRTRSHRLDTTQLVAGTSEVDFYREIRGDNGWRGPALLLRLDPDEGVAIIQHQGRPYLVSIRHIRPHVRTFATQQDSLCLNDQSEDDILDIMKTVEMVPPYRNRFLGYIPEHKATGLNWRKVPPEEHFDAKMFAKAVSVSTSLTTRTLSGMVYGRATKVVKPPKDTIGYLVTWNVGSLKYHIQEHWTSDAIKLKKVVASGEDDVCWIYLFYHVLGQEETTQADFKKSNMVPEDMSVSNSDDVLPTSSPTSMDDQNITVGVKRDGPDSRTVVLAPEKKRMRLDYWASHSIYYNASSIHHLMNVRRKIKDDLPSSWTGAQLWAENRFAEDFFLEEIKHKQQCDDLRNHAYLMHIGSSHDAILNIDLRTTEVYRVDTEHDDIQEDDVYQIWKQVDEADRAEVAQFVHEGVFQKIHRDALTQDHVVIDCRWVRKWKKMSNGSKKVKSRLCARGCLDKQKDLLTTRSTTATRLSQRLLLSTAAVFDLEVESWDIGGAFLKGLSFREIRQMLLKMGINSPVRAVVVLPPPNVWRHLGSLSKDFRVNDFAMWGLLCVKPIYGLNDAPLAWQLCLREYLQQIHGVPSSLDENSWRWKNDQGELIALCTTHVDDLAIAASPSWLKTHYEAFVQKFKKVSRQQLPFEHCGARYERLPDGYRMIQSDFCAKMLPAKIDNGRKDNDKLTKEETTSYRSILGALLWLAATRLDLVADVSHLATHVTTAEIRHLRQANQVLKQAQDVKRKDVGLYFRKLHPEHGLRIACFHDSSSHTKEKAYAHEGVLILLMEDHVRPDEQTYEMTCDDVQAQLHGGHAHILWSHGSKAKRISYSTSHAETLAAISGHEAAMLVSVRLSEMLHQSRSPSLQQLAAIQEAGNPQLPIDDYGDCNDVFQLTTGCKTLPQDKNQRIYVLSLRESRLAGRIRWMALVPTRSMIADALTKPMISAQMMQLLTTGCLTIENEETHHVQMKRLPPKYEIDEADLNRHDEELIEEYQKVKHHTENLWMTPMMAAVKKGVFPLMALMVLSSLPLAHANEDGVSNPAVSSSQDNVFFYLMILFTIFVLVVERILFYFGERLMNSFRNLLTTFMMSSLSPQSATQRPPTPPLATTVPQSDDTRQTNRLWSDDMMTPKPQADEADIQIARLQEELKRAMDEITKTNQTAQREKMQFMRKNMALQKEIDMLKSRLNEPGAPPMTSEHVPDHLYFMPNGECFHMQSCPTVCSPYNRPMKLAKCKRCF